MIRFLLHSSFLFIIWRKCIKNTVYWNHWLSFVFITIIEMFSLAFSTKEEKKLIIFLWKNSIFFFILISFLVLFYWRFKLKAIWLYISGDETDMFYKYIAQSVLAYFTRDLYTKTKNKFEYNSRCFKKKNKKRLKEKKIFNPLNYNFLLYNNNLLTWLYLKRALVYIIGLYFIYHYIIVLYWSNYLNLITIVYWGYNSGFKLLIILYIYIFWNFLINSFFFDKLLFNWPLRYSTFYLIINCADCAQTTDEAIYEFTFIETYMLVPEETSMYWMSYVDGDWEYKEMWPFWHDLDTPGICRRFKVPFNWLNRKTYVYDAYYRGPIYTFNNFFQQPYYYLLHEIDVHTNLKALEWDDEYEGNLKINI